MLKVQNCFVYLDLKFWIYLEFSALCLGFYFNWYHAVQGQWQWYMIVSDDGLFQV